MQRQGEFAESIAARVGRRVEYFRTGGRSGGRGKLTVQGLADRCTDLGLQLDRSVIAKLEKGLRQTITIGEILVLARALDVPPVLLVFPIGHDAEVEVLPDQVVSTWDAAKWFAGDEPLILRDEKGDPATLGADELAAWNGGVSPVPLFREHDRLLAQRAAAQTMLAGAYRAASQATSDEQKQLQKLRAESEERHVREIERSLWDLRAHLQREGFTPPPLPAELEPPADGE